MSYDSGLPDAAFTEGELAAGVPGLMRGDSDDWMSAPLPTREIEPNCSQEELVALVVKGLTSKPLSVIVKSTLPPPPWGGDMYFSSFDGVADEPCLTVFITIDEDYHVPVSFLIKALRESGLPLFTEEYNGAWAAWDSRDLCLRTGPVSSEWAWANAATDLKRSGAARSDRESHLIKVLRKLMLATDHGKKPLLLQRQFLSVAMQRRAVDFDAPKRILNDALKWYVLAYHDSVGEIKSIPLTDAAKLGFPIVTRNSAYLVDNGILLPLLNKARLLANAHVIATQYHANRFKFFLAREQGTLFNSAIERIDFGDREEVGYETQIPCAAVDIANEISEWSTCQFGQIYITVDGHPLDSELVTTPALYEQAVERLKRLGWNIYHSYSDDVILRQREGDEWGEEGFIHY